MLSRRHTARRAHNRAAVAGPLQPLIYGETVNLTLLDLIGRVDGNVLDIGCGAGAWGPALRRAGAQRIVGLEPHAPAAALARATYDGVFTASIHSLSTLVARSTIDLVVFADVLEHLVDPWDALSRAHRVASPGARLAVSVPNLRYHGLIWRLALRGHFEYVDDGGLMDRTHLRWFTHRSLDRALRAAGWLPEVWGGPVGRLGRATRACAGPRFDAVVISQICVIARAVRPGVA